MCFKVASESLVFGVADQETTARVKDTCLLSRCTGIGGSDALSKQ